LDPHLQPCTAKEKNDALDNLSGSAGSVGFRNGHLLHRRRADSRPAGHWLDPAGSPRDSGTQDLYLAQFRGPPAIGQRIATSQLGEKKMPLINIVIALIVVGVALWLINNFIPMAYSIKTILNIVVVVAVAIWVLQAVGLWGRITSYRFTQ